MGEIMKNICIIGAGSFGIALGVLLANKKNKVNIYDIDINVINDININRKNDKYIKGLNIPDNISKIKQKSLYAFTQDLVNICIIIIPNAVNGP